MVKLSTRLKDSPVCIVSGEGLSLEMENILKQMPNSQEVKAERILELNPDHKFFEVVKRVYKDSPEQLKNYSTLLYNQALIIEGLPMEDPLEYITAMNELLLK